MRDYRNTASEDFLAECIEMKIKWLARRLRWTDEPAEIGQWVITVTSVHDLLQKIKAKGAIHPTQSWNYVARAPSTKKRYTVSDPNTISIEGDWGSEMEVEAAYSIHQQRELNNLSADAIPLPQKNACKQAEDTQNPKKRRRVIKGRKQTMEHKANSKTDEVT